jgi:hypothetical protein
MTAAGNFKNWIYGWLPKDPTFPLTGNQKIRLAAMNRRIIDKKLRLGSVTVALILVIFGAFVYNTFSQPIHYGYGVGYPLRLEVEESLQSYVRIDSHGMQGSSGGDGNGGIAGWEILNGTISWIASPFDSIKSLSDLHLVIYTRIDDRNYRQDGSLEHLYLGTHIQVFKNEPTLPNGTIDHFEISIPKIGWDTPSYQYYVNCSTSINKNELGNAQ